MQSIYKYIFILSLIVLISKLNFGQSSGCPLVNNPQRLSINNQNSLLSICNDWNTYTTLNDNTNIKYVRIAYHLFNKNDGTGNIPNNPTNRQMLHDFTYFYINNKMNNLSVMNLPTSSPHIADSKIQFVLDTIYFWNDTFGWDGTIDNQVPAGSEKGDSLYTTYVVNKHGVKNKYTTLHVFISGLGGNVNGHGGGQAKWFGAKEWVLVNSIYQAYLNNTMWNASGLLRHELGHALGLYHSWSGDNCNDTPNNPNCWDNTQPGCNPNSNNTMDYNVSQDALTRCQINTVHYFLLGNQGNISDCIISGVNVTTPIVSGPTSICNPNGSNYTINNLQLGVNDNATAYPSTLFQNADICGGPVINFKPASTASSGGAILTFTTGFGVYGNTFITKRVWVGTRPSVLNVCSFTNNPQIYGATTINSPGTGCTSTSVPLNQDVTFIAETTNLNQGFEVPLGATFEVIPEIISCQ